MMTIDSIAWFNDADCRDIGPSVFFPHREDNEHIARAICKVCPVKEACLDFAIEHKIEFGIWGGVGIRERKRIARQRRAS